MDFNNYVLNNIDDSIMRFITTIDLFSHINDNNDNNENNESNANNENNYNFNITYTTIYGIDNYLNTEQELEEILNMTFQDDLENHSRNETTSYNLLIKTRRYKKIKNKYPEEKKCSICLADYEDEDRIVVNLNCKHIFHKDCLKSWGNRSKKCPICRNEMEVKDSF
jgi:hypothetical protein